MESDPCELIGILRRTLELVLRNRDFSQERAREFHRATSRLVAQLILESRTHESRIHESRIHESGIHESRFHESGIHKPRIEPVSLAPNTAPKPINQAN
jgi:hypothetical protein